MDQLRQLLDTIEEDPGIKFASIMSSDGFIIESSRGATSRDQIVSAAVSEVVGLAGRIGGEIDTGQCRSMLLQYEQLSIYIEPVNREAILAVASNGNAARFRQTAAFSIHSPSS